MQRNAWVLGLVLSLLSPAPLEAETTEVCSSPKPGRYVVMGEGQVAQQPTAHLILEEWLPDGRIEGIAFQRSGQDFRSESYSGTYQAQSRCQAVVRRPLTSSIASSIEDSVMSSRSKRFLYLPSPRSSSKRKAERGSAPPPTPRSSPAAA